MELRLTQAMAAKEGEEMADLPSSRTSATAEERASPDSPPDEVTGASSTYKESWREARRVLGVLSPEFPAFYHTYIFREAKALEEEGFIVHFLSTRKPKPANFAQELLNTYSKEVQYIFPSFSFLNVMNLKNITDVICYINACKLSVKGKLKLLAMAASAARLKGLCQKLGIDHLHVHSFSDAAHLAAMCRIMGGPAYSVALHGGLGILGGDYAQKTSRARFLVAVTGALTRDLKNMFPEKDIRTIWMGVDTQRFRPPDQDAHPDSSVMRLATIARLHPSKGHVHALRALAGMKSAGAAFTYRIAGAGPARARLEAQAAELGLSEQVGFLGPLAEMDVSKLLMQTDIFLLPSVGFGEAAPVSVMEAMAAGVAVVASRIGGTPEMIQDGVDGFLVDQEDVEGLSRAILRLQSDPELRRRIGENARKKAMERFDYRASARALAEAIIA